MNILQNFIVFEGIDGSGTSTQSQMLCDYLNAMHKVFFKTAEPSDNIIGKFIRKSVLKETSGKLMPESILYLYISDRYEHVYGKNGIIENANSGKIIIQDRYLFSSLAYQSVDTKYNKVFNLNKEFPYPQYLFYLSCPVEICMKRIISRNKEKELFEKEDFLKKVVRNYESSFSSLPKGVKFYKIDSTKSPNDIFDIVKKELNDFLTNQ